MQTATGRTAKKSEPIRTLSGPVSVRTYDTTAVGGGGTLYLMGDVHFSDDHACVPCRAEDGCASVTSFVDRLAARGPLDVFVELPYVPRRGDQQRPRSRALSALDRRFGTSSAADTRGKRREGGSDVYIGVLGTLYKRFRDRIYEHSHADGGTRVHFADIRLEPNVNALLRPEWVSEHVTSIDALRAVMRAFLYARDFAAEIASAVGASGAAQVSKSALSSSPPCHKVAKQFLAAPEGDVKDAARKYLDERLEELLDIFSKDVGLPFAPQRAQARKTDVYYKDWLDAVHVAHAKAQQWSLARAVRFGLRVLVMDAYLVFRVMRFGAAGDAVVYVGDSHADLYARFLQDYLGLKPRSSHLADSRRSRGGSERRCVPL
jgi:hypothetical protein